MTLAKALVHAMGKRLIGRKVLVSAMGSYPGGCVTVVELHPDPGAPDISFNVRHDDGWTDAFGHNTMGIFEWENVDLVRQPHADCWVKEDEKKRAKTRHS